MNSVMVMGNLAKDGTGGTRRRAERSPLYAADPQMDERPRGRERGYRLYPGRRGGNRRKRQEPLAKAHVFVEGRFQTRSYEAKEGENVT